MQQTFSINIYLRLIFISRFSMGSIAHEDGFHFIVLYILYLSFFKYRYIKILGQTKSLNFIFLKATLIFARINLIFFQCVSRPSLLLNSAV